MSVIPRKAINFAFVLGLVLCLPWLLWTSLWACVTPDSCPPLFIFRRWLRSKNILKSTRDFISGKGLVPHVPGLPKLPQLKPLSSLPAWVASATALIRVICIHPSHFSFLILPCRLSSFAQRICKVLIFVRSFPQFWQQSLSLLSQSKPQLTAVFPLPPSNHCKWISLSPWNL